MSDVRHGSPAPAAAPTTPPLREEDIDWGDARERMRRVVRAQMTARPDHVVDDVTSDGLVRLIRLVRARPVDHLQGAIEKCGDFAVRDFVRAWLRKRAAEGKLTLHSEGGAAVPGGVREEVHDPFTRMEFVTRAILAERQSRCVELLDAYVAHQDWALVAQTLGRAATAVRKQWQRCREVVEATVRASGSTLFEWIFEHEEGASA